MSSDDFAVVVTAPSEFAAETKAAVLKSNGIEATVIRNAPSWTGQVSISPTAIGASVLVHRDDLEQARAVLDQTIEDSVDLDWDQVDVGEREDTVPLGKVHRMPPLARIAFALATALLVLSGILGFVLLVLPDATTTVRLLDLEGRAVDPFAAPRAAVTVFLFVRSDCPISNRYAPEIRRLHETFSPRDVEFVLVYPDPQQTPQAIRQHLKDYRYAFGAVRDPRHAMVELTGATITPEAAVFLPSGKMVYRGRIDDRYVALGQVRAAPTTHDLDDAIESALEGRTIENPTTKAVGCIIADLK